MANQTIILKATREAVALESMGMTFQNAISVAAGTMGCESSEIARAMQRRSAEARARNREKQRRIDRYWEMVNED